jgi:hypothetical protein
MAGIHRGSRRHLIEIKSEALLRCFRSLKAVPVPPLFGSRTALSGLSGRQLPPVSFPLVLVWGVRGTPTAATAPTTPPATRHGAAGCGWTTCCVFVLGVEGEAR